ncbi:MAG: hypothetical protein ACRDOO_03095, partial [Actinomadura sp.]
GGTSCAAGASVVYRDGLYGDALFIRLFGDPPGVRSLIFIKLANSLPNPVRDLPKSTNVPA